MKLPNLTDQEKLDEALDDMAREQENTESMQLRRLEETGRVKSSFLDKLTGKKYRKGKKTKIKSKRKPTKKCKCK